MSASLLEAIRLLVHNKGISEELIIQLVDEVLLAAYKKQFGSSDNAITKINEETGEIHLYSRKEVVDKVETPLLEISLKEVQIGNKDCEIGDEVLIEIKLNELGRIAAQTAKQVVTQRLREIDKNIIYSEYKQKIGQIVTGICQRKRNGHIFVDLGRTEAIIPNYEQSPKEIFSIGERVKSIIIDVRDDKDTQVVLSRSSPAFVQGLFELDVPEIDEGVINIKSIVRKPGYRTKIAVYSQDIDPVGPCVGMKGMRIQNIVKELEGEKVDIIRYKEDIKEYITNALSPAKVEQIIILNEEEKEALAVVGEDQLSLAIGKQGHNVKLASSLTSWSLDIKSKDELEEAGYEDESRRAVENLFASDDSDDYTEETHPIEELEEIDNETITILKNEGIDTLEKLVEQTKEKLIEIDSIDEAKADSIIKIIQDNIVIVDDEDEIQKAEDNEEDTAEEIEESKDEVKNEEDTKQEEELEEYEEVTYYCPECNSEVQENVTQCPSCGVELVFE